jgi:hypothetical protein
MNRRLNNMTTVRVFNICLAVAVGLLLGGCAVTDMSHDVDFNQYRTFGFSTAEVNVNNPAYKSGLISSKIRKNIRSEFEKHGLKYTKKNPDLLVSYETFTQEKEQMSANYGAYPFMFPGMYYRGFPYAWGYPYMPYGMYGPGRMYYYTEGTLIIDVTDANTNEQVWRGLVKGNVSDLNALQKSIDKGVRAIMKKYPGKVNPGDDGRPATDTIMAPPKKRTS